MMADEQTLQAIADQLGLSRQRIEQILKRAFMKMRKKTKIAWGKQVFRYFSKRCASSWDQGGE